MQNPASAPLTDAESEIQAATPGELASKILQLRAKGDAKNNPKKPKSPSAPRANAPDSAPLAASATAEITAPGSANLENLAAGLENLTQLVSAVQEQFAEQNSARDRAFDLLYEELGSYKNDFYLERLKPTLRALLFLLDSIEGFEREIDDFDARGAALSSEIVRVNLVHFRVQLADVLTLSEMTPIEPNGDSFDPKTQRAVEVVAVDADKNNTVQRQIRSGWTLGGKMLRPADVVVGRSS